jgi:hypothetical protein
MHIPLRCYLEAGNPADTTVDWQALLQALSHHRHAVSFAGHLHATEHHYLERPAVPGSAPVLPHHHHALTAACGSWWSGPRDQRGIPCADSTDGTPNGFHVLSVAGNRYSTRLVPAATKAPAQLRVLIDGPHRSARRRDQAHLISDRLGLSVACGSLGACRVVANVFDGGPKTRVTLEVLRSAGGSDPLAMIPAAIPDPLIAELLSGDTPRKAGVAATACAHLWQAPLPSGLAPGAHVLQIRATDEYGRAHTARTVLEVTA